MDRDTYEQLMQVQISIDELNEKIDLVLDEIDELKENNNSSSSTLIENSSLTRTMIKNTPCGNNGISRLGAQDSGLVT